MKENKLRKELVPNLSQNSTIPSKNIFSPSKVFYESGGWPIKKYF
jgi:hypothetical protein